ncbi:hypothetical protein KH5H1_58090 [Corallococcus caeni]|nr:hypothetical protein KH5H1_58090 [Corallococcus sp. KH5-1]
MNGLLDPFIAKVRPVDGVAIRGGDTDRLPAPVAQRDRHLMEPLHLDVLGALEEALAEIEVSLGNPAIPITRATVLPERRTGIPDCHSAGAVFDG